MHHKDALQAAAAKQKTPLLGELKIFGNPQYKCDKDFP